MKTLLVLVAIAVCFSAYAATDVRGGAWTAEVDGDSVQLTLFGGDHDSKCFRAMGNIIGFSEPLSSFSGLSKRDALSSAANVRFEIRRPAGTIAFDGRFADGTGAGQFRFTPSASFVREMASLGYRGFRDDQLLVFAVNDFSPQTIRALRAMGYQLTKREVEEMGWEAGKRGSWEARRSCSFPASQRPSFPAHLIIGRSTPRSLAISIARS